jgi:hypothetical protein
MFLGRLTVRSLTDRTISAAGVAEAAGDIKLPLYGDADRFFARAVSFRSPKLATAE